MNREIVVGYDGSTHADEALAWAAQSGPTASTLPCGSCTSHGRSSTATSSLTDRRT